MELTPDEALRAVDGLLRQIAQRYASSRAPEADLWQEARLAFIQSLPRYDPKLGALTTWADLQARMACRRYLSNHSLTIRFPRYQWEAGKVEDLTTGEDARIGHDPMAAVDDRLCMEQALERLNDRQRAIVRLHLEGYTDVEIGTHFSITRSAVGQQRQLAFRTLRAALAA